MGVQGVGGYRVTGGGRGPGGGVGGESYKCAAWGLFR